MFVLHSLLSSADVSVTLRNKGRDAYKPEVYGSAITVDLKITREGMRTYKLRSKSGKCQLSCYRFLISLCIHHCYNLMIQDNLTLF